MISLGVSQSQRFSPSCMNEGYSGLLLSVQKASRYSRPHSEPSIPINIIQPHVRVRGPDPLGGWLLFFCKNSCWLTSANILKSGVRSNSVFSGVFVRTPLACTQWFTQQHNEGYWVTCVLARGFVDTTGRLAN